MKEKQIECIVESCPGNKNGMCIQEQASCDTYGCNLCGVRMSFEEQTHWLTSNYGVCDRCYQTLSEEEKERIYAEYE